jgi:hypothetical protein
MNGSTPFAQHQGFAQGGETRNLEAGHVAGEACRNGQAVAFCEPGHAPRVLRSSRAGTQQTPRCGGTIQEAVVV